MFEVHAYYGHMTPEESGSLSLHGLSPEEALRALLKLSPEDAEAARRDAAASEREQGED